MNCKCGCGEEVNKERMFIKGHNRRNSHHTKEAKKQMSVKRKGKKLTKESIKKRTITRNRNGWFSKEGKLSFSLAQRGKNMPKWSEERLENYMPKIRDENPNWKGGITSINKYIRSNKNTIINRNVVFKRDNYTCQKCDKRGCYIEAHHINFVSKIIRNYNIKTFEEADKCEELWDIDNLVTLCRKCHKIREHNWNIG